MDGLKYIRCDGCHWKKYVEEDWTGEYPSKCKECRGVKTRTERKPKEERIMEALSP